MVLYNKDIIHIKNYTISEIKEIIEDIKIKFPKDYLEYEYKRIKISDYGKTLSSQRILIDELLHVNEKNQINRFGEHILIRDLLFIKVIKNENKYDDNDIFILKL